MSLLSRRICLAAAAATPLLAALPAVAQMYTTYGLQFPLEVLGFKYNGAWPVSGPNKEKALVAGYNGGDKGEASVMVYENLQVSQAPDEQKLVQEREALIERMGPKKNAALQPKIISKGTIKLPGLPQPLATTHMTTEFGDDREDVYYFLTPIKGRVVGISYKTKADPKSLESAKAFALQFGLAFQQNAEPVR